MQITREINVETEPIQLSGDALCVAFLLSELGKITKVFMQLTNNNNNSTKIELTDVIIDYYDLEKNTYKIINKTSEKELFDFATDEPNKLDIISSILDDCNFIIFLYDIVLNMKNTYDEIKKEAQK